MAASIIVSTGAATQAQAPQPIAAGTCNEAQVLFITDQSGSMSQTNEGVAPSDPQGLRFEGPRTAIELLSVLRARTYQTATIKVAVVHFGDTVRTQLPWTPLEVTSTTDVERLKQALATPLAAVPSMGNTNHAAAFQYASSLFNELRKPVQGCPIRLVVMVTDGQPYVNIPGFTVGQHLKTLTEYVRQYMPSPEYRIVVAGLDKNNRYWQSVLPYWESITGDSTKARRVTDGSELAAFIFDVIQKAITGDEAKGVRGLQPSGGEARLACVTGKALDIPPYLQYVRLTLIKPLEQKNLVLDVADESGQLLRPTRTDVVVTSEGRNDIVEILEVTRPRPGRWTIQTQLPPTSGEVCYLNLLSFDATVKLLAPATGGGLAPASGGGLTPASGDKVVQFKKSNIALQIVDSKGAALPDYGDAKYAPQVQVSLVRAGSPAISVSLKPSGTLTYAGEFLPLEAGTYQMSVKAVSRNVDGSEFVIVNKPLGSVPVAPIKLVHTNAASGAVPQYQATSLQFEVQADGQPVVLDLKPTIQISVTGPAGAGDIAITQTQSISLPARTVSTFTPAKAGDYTVRCGGYIDTPTGRIMLPTDEIKIRVDPASMVDLVFLEPTANTFVATDYRLRPSGLSLRAMLVDQDGKEVNPSSMGIGDISQLFQVKVVDAKSKADVSKEVFSLNQTNGGYFQLGPNALGPGDYEIRVETQTRPNSSFVWGARPWKRELTGVVNPVVYVLMAIAAGILLVLVLIGLRYRALTVHPLSGRITLLSQKQRRTGNGEVEFYKQRVNEWDLTTRWNRQSLVGPLTRGAGLVQRLDIRCTSPEQSKRGGCEVRVKLKGRAKADIFPLSPGSEKSLIGQDLVIVKDYKPGSSAAASSAEGPGAAGELSKRKTY